MLIQDGGVGKPDVGDSRSDENKVPRVKGLHRIAHDSFPGSFGNEAQFKLLVIVPGALVNVILKYTDEE
jgi:hypothetical protein